MKVVFATLGNQIVPSSRTRVFQWIPYLEKHSINCSVVPFSFCFRYSWKIDRINRNSLIGNTLFYFLLFACRSIDLAVFPLCAFRLMKLAKKSDWVIIQKILFPKIFLNALKHINPNIGFDFDDAIQELSTQAATKVINTFAVSKFISLENDFNQGFANTYSTAPILKILGPIDVNRYKPPKLKNKKDITVIGWIGSPTTTVHLYPIITVLQKVLEKFSNVHIHVIGASKNLIEHERFHFKNWSLASECKDLQEFDIGIMPLIDSPISLGKGGYKLLQYMALGIPSIASPVGVNTFLVQDGKTGYLADSNEAWLSHLSELIEDPLLRERLGHTARRIVVQNYSFESYSELWSNTLKKLLN